MWSRFEINARERSANIGTTGTIKREILITTTRQPRFHHMYSGLGRDCFEV
jgi:hypothetical protein